MSAESATPRAAPQAPPHRWPSLLAMSVAVVLALAIVGKVRDPRAFLDAVRSITPIPTPLVLPAAGAVVAVECVLLLLLLHPRHRRIGGIVGAALFAFFFLLNAWLAAKGLDSDCACFGVLIRLPRESSLALDSLLLAASILLAREPRGRVTPATVLLPPKPADVPTDSAASGAEPIRVPALPWLCFLLALSLYAFVRVLPRDPVLYDRATRHFRARAAQRDHKAQDEIRRRLRLKDPPIGTELPMPWAPGGPALTPPSSGVAPAHAEAQPKAFLLVFFGSCSGCAVAKLREVEDLMARYPGLRALAVSPSPTAELSHARSRYGLRIGLVSDKDGRYAKRYNAAWVPRAYILSPSGKLSWCQAGDRADPREIGAAVERVMSK